MSLSIWPATRKLCCRSSNSGFKDRSEIFLEIGVLSPCRILCGPGKKPGPQFSSRLLWQKSVHGPDKCQGTSLEVAEKLFEFCAR